MNQREAVVREYSPGEILCRQGAGATRLLILRRGGVRCTVVPDKVLVEADDARVARGHIVANHHEAGTLIGLESALAGHYQSSVVAVDTTVVAEVPIDARGLMSVMTDHPQIGVSLARAMAKRMMGANRSLGSAQRQASRYMRDFQGLCSDFYNLVQRIGEGNPGEDEIVEALNAAKRTWTYSTGESGGAEVARNTRTLLARIVEDKRVTGKQRMLNPGDYLCRKGDAGGTVYLLVSGRLSVRVGNELFGVIRPGETVGEMGVLMGDSEPKRMADIIADEPSLCGVIRNDQFISVISAQPRLLINLCKTMTLRVKSFEQLAAESDDALRAVAARFDGSGGSFEQDVSELRRRLTMLLDESDLELQPEVDTLSRLAERWSERMSDLREKIGVGRPA